MQRIYMADFVETPVHLSRLLTDLPRYKMHTTYIFHPSRVEGEPVDI